MHERVVTIDTRRPRRNESRGGRGQGYDTSFLSSSDGIYGAVMGIRNLVSQLFSSVYHPESYSSDEQSFDYNETSEYAIGDTDSLSEELRQDVSGDEENSYYIKGSDETQQTTTLVERVTNPASGFCLQEESWSYTSSQSEGDSDDSSYIEGDSDDSSHIDEQRYERGAGCNDPVHRPLVSTKKKDKVH